MRVTTRFFFGSTRTTDRVPGSAIQIAPSPTAIPAGCPPIGIVASTESVAGSMRVSVPVPTGSGGQQRKAGRAATQIAPSPNASAVGMATPSRIADVAAFDLALIGVTPTSLPTQTDPSPIAIPDAPGAPPMVPVLKPKLNPPTLNVAVTLFAAPSILETANCG